ncbi:MAG: 5-formyltetrahydrofolate cyclo-ligase [Rhizobiaceae bacterium]
MLLQEQKAAIRAEVLAKRDGLAPDSRIEKSLQAAEFGAKNIEFDPGTVISGFFPIRSEIDPRPLMDVLRIKGARLCLPIVANKTTILFRELVRGAELTDTGFGTRGPGEDVEVLDPDILIMPLSAYDLNGGRIGYGAGHYDRAIQRLLDRNLTPRLIGLAFECQQVSNVPMEPHDQALHAMISEDGFFKIGN